MKELVSILINSLFVVLGCVVMILSKYIPYEWIQPRPSQYTVTNKSLYIKEARRLIYIIGVYYVFVGLLYIAGIKSIFFYVSIPLIPLVLFSIANSKLKKYYKKVSSDHIK